MSQSDRSRKLFVRSVLAGTSTLATLMGAQSLAMIDNIPIDDAAIEDAVLELTLMPTIATFPTPEAIPTDRNTARLEDTLEPTLMKVEPSITIFRQAGSANVANDELSDTTAQQNTTIEVMSNTSTNTNRVIQPPSPVELAAPEPIVIVEERIVQPPPVQVQQPPPQPQPQAQQQKKSKKSKSGSSK